MNTEDVNLLKKLARLRGMKVSQLCRLIILEWLRRHDYLDEERVKIAWIKGGRDHE